MFIDDERVIEDTNSPLCPMAPMGLGDRCDFCRPYVQDEYPRPVAWNFNLACSPAGPSSGTDGVRQWGLPESTAADAGLQLGSNSNPSVCGPWWLGVSFIIRNRAQRLLLTDHGSADWRSNRRDSFAKQHYARAGHSAAGHIHRSGKCGQFQSQRGFYRNFRGFDTHLWLEPFGHSTGLQFGS